MGSSVVVVGSGFSGSILAREIADDFDVDVRIIERRPHIAGNMYDEADQYGIMVQKYGPHFINTNKWWIVDYLSRYARLIPYNCKLVSCLDGRYVRLPWNFTTVQQLLGGAQAEKLIAAMRDEYAGRETVTIFELCESENELISEYGNMLYKKAFETYSSKMWGIPIEQLDRSVAGRVPMRMNYDERYLIKDFQCLPEHGFTKLFERMLDHDRIHVSLGRDAIDAISFEDDVVLFEGKKPLALVFTGAIDELFGERFGSLPYRSLDIQYRYEEYPALPCDCVSYPQADGYTRDTEYRRMTFGEVKGQKSLVAREFPLEYDRHALVGNQPFYPVMNEANRNLYERYRELADQYGNLFLSGRLAEYRYFNMDLVIEHTFETYKTIRAYLEDALRGEEG